MIDYLNPSRISANPPNETGPFCGEICTANCNKTAPSGDYTDTDRDYTDTAKDYTDEEADNG